MRNINGMNIQDIMDVVFEGYSYTLYNYIII
jgi:hypothetical protein